jgi:hypothetical protein
MYMGIGARSNVLSTYVVALILADVLAGPLPWTYVGAVVAAGAFFSRGFALYRDVQSQGLTTAMGTVLGQYGHEVYTHDEGASMIVKESFIVSLVDRSGATQGVRYFAEQVLSLLPRQLVPDKMGWMHMADFLSSEFLGREAARGAGVAGAMVADGYWMGGDFGVGVLAAVLGLLLAVLVRTCLRDDRQRKGVALWWVVLLAGFCSRLFFVIRGDLSLVLTEVLYDMVMPAIAVGFFVWRYPASAWNRTLTFPTGNSSRE